jgi:hypothetical protein
MIFINIYKISSAHSNLLYEIVNNILECTITVNLSIFIMNYDELYDIINKY